jgi:tetratricopeptide (TPR) repeat protein
MLQTTMRSLPTLLLSTALAAAFMWSLPALLATAGLAVTSGQVLAEEQERREKTRRTPALRNQVYERLQEAQVAAEANDFAGAQEVLRKLEKEFSGKNALNSYEAANVYNFYAFIYYSQEKYQDAIRAYEKVLEQTDIPEAMEVGTLYSLAQLNFVVEDYRKAAELLRRWFALALNPNPDAYMLLAQANYQLKEYDAALRNVLDGMAEAERRDIAPKEQWYLLLRVLYYEKNDIPKTVEVLETLVQNWPKKDYWLQLSGMYGELKQDSKQLSAMEAAYEQGLLDRERELVNMAYLYMGGEMPWKAAQVLKKGMDAEKIEPTAKHLETLGIALRQAQHTKDAIPYLERAAETGDDAELWGRLANIYLDADRFNECTNAARKALDMGGLRRRDNTQVVLGMCLYNRERLQEARRAFVDASKDERSERIARQWVRYIDTEIERKAELARSF